MTVTYPSTAERPHPQDQPGPRAHFCSTHHQAAPRALCASVPAGVTFLGSSGLGALAAWAPVAMPWTVMERPAWCLRPAVSTMPHRDSAAWERPGRPRLQAPGSEGGRHPGSGRPTPCGRFPPGAQGRTSSQLGPWVREHPTGGSRAPGVGGLALAASVGGDLPALCLCLALGLCSVSDMHACRLPLTRCPDAGHASVCRGRAGFTWRPVRAVGAGSLCCADQVRGCSACTSPACAGTAGDSVTRARGVSVCAFFFFFG